MMLDYCFHGDNNQFLKWVQDDMRGKTLYHLVSTVRRKYLDACYLVGYSSDFSSEVQKIETFDYSLLKRGHDTMAAWYRYKYADRVTQLRLPFSEQVRNPLVALRKEYEVGWWRFWWQEIDEISSDGQMTRAILKAIVYRNSARGYAAEDLIWVSLVDRYNATEWLLWLRHEIPRCVLAKHNPHPHHFLISLPGNDQRSKPERK